MSQQIKVPNAAQLTSGQKKLIRAKGKEVALFNIEGTFYAISNSCPHSTGPLVEGKVHQTIVTCPWHGAKFDVTTGQCLGGPATTNVATYPVYIENNSIIIEIPT